jgi:2-polyprenyl-6-methoxyphenol hydroxylase-like FAD-dependent oxidoreductase
METPVLIVGGGPVGLALAGDLGWRGLSCLQIERSDGQVTQPKMDMVHIRTMEFCRRWGIVDAVEQSGYTRAHAQDNVWVTALAGGFELGREVFPNCIDEKCPPQSPQKRERAPQNFFDPALARFVRTFPQVQQRYHTELVDFTEDADGVTAQIRNIQTGETETVRAQYLIGCDGAGSRVREKLGITMTGNPVLTYTTNVVFRSRDLEAAQDITSAYRYIFVDDEGTWATLVAIDGRDHFRFSLVGNRDKRQLSDDELVAAVRRAVGTECEIEIVSTMPWTRRELVADSYGSNRCWLVGDSAHQLSPTGAFGMNTGLQESLDISWKLEACLRGWGGPKLLPSYEAERKPVAARNVAEAARNLARMLETRSRKPPKEIFDKGPAGDAARKDYGVWYTERMSHEWFTIGVQIGYRYDGSPVCVPDDTTPPPFDVATYVQTSHAGARAPHVWLKDGRSTLDLFGKGFVLLQIGSPAADASKLVEAAAGAKVPLQVIALDEPDVVAVYEKKLVLVRPDGHVAWRGDAVPQDARALIDTVRGA